MTERDRLELFFRAAMDELALPKNRPTMRFLADLRPQVRVNVPGECFAANCASLLYDCVDMVNALLTLREQGTGIYLVAEHERN